MAETAHEFLLSRNLFHAYPRACESFLHQLGLFPFLYCFHFQKTLHLIEKLLWKRLRHRILIDFLHHALQLVVTAVELAHFCQFDEILSAGFVFFLQNLCKSLRKKHFPHRLRRLTKRRVQSNPVKIIFNDKVAETMYRRNVRRRNQTYLALQMFIIRLIFQFLFQTLAKTLFHLRRRRFRKRHD